MVTQSIEQVAASGSPNIEGSLITGDVVSLDFRSYQLPDYSRVVSVPVGNSETITSLIDKFVAAINADSVFHDTFGGSIKATTDGATCLTVVWAPGPLGNQVSVEVSSTKSNAIQNSFCMFSGGSGTVTAQDDFSFYNSDTKQIIPFRKGDVIGVQNFPFGDSILGDGAAKSLAEFQEFLRLCKYHRLPVA